MSGRPNLVLSPGPGLWSLVLGPFGPDLGPDLDLTWDLDLDLSLTIGGTCVGTKVKSKFRVYDETLLYQYSIYSYVTTALSFVSLVVYGN